MIELGFVLLFVVFCYSIYLDCKGGDDKDE